MGDTARLWMIPVGISAAVYLLWGPVPFFEWAAFLVVITITTRRWVGPNADRLNARDSEERWKWRLAVAPFLLVSVILCFATPHFRGLLHGPDAGEGIDYVFGTSWYPAPPEPAAPPMAAPAKLRPVISWGPAKGRLGPKVFLYRHHKMVGGILDIEPQHVDPPTAPPYPAALFEDSATGDQHWVRLTKLEKFEVCSDDQAWADEQAEAERKPASQDER